MLSLLKVGSSLLKLVSFASGVNKVLKSWKSACWLCTNSISPKVYPLVKLVDRLVGGFVGITVANHSSSSSAIVSCVALRVD